MENRGALRFLVGTLSRQPHQRRQSAQPRYTSCAQPRRQRTSSGGLHPTKKPNLPRGPVPPIAQQARRSESHHRHGSSLGPIGLSHAEVWSALRRQRCGILRTTKPPATNRVPQKEGGPTRPTARTSLSMRKKFLESRTGSTGRLIGNCPLPSEYFAWQATDSLLQSKCPANQFVSHTSRARRREADTHGGRDSGCGASHGYGGAEGPRAD